MNRIIESIMDALGIVGPIKFGFVGVIVRLVAMPPTSRGEAVQLVVVGMGMAIGAITAAQYLAPGAVAFSAFVAGLIGGAVAVKLIQYTTSASIGDILDLIIRRTPRPPQPPQGPVTPPADEEENGNDGTPR